MLVPLCFASLPREARTSQHIVRNCRQLRHELETLLHETEIPIEDYEELSLRLERLQHQALALRE
jgi:hypothetical protein